MDFARWLAGGAGARGRRAGSPTSPAATGGIGDWSVEDIAYFLETGFLPDFDSVGGSMVEVQENLAMLDGRGPRRDRRLPQGGAAAGFRRRPVTGRRALA